MKKILFLLLSVAIATSAFARVPVTKTQTGKTIPQAAKITTSQVLSYHQNLQTMDINAPRVQAPQRNVFPGLSVLKRSMNPNYRASVTEQPDGDVSYYRRSGMALYNHYTGSSIDAEYGEQSGFIKVVTNGNNVWFENLIYDPEGLYPESLWVKGTKSGSTITISLPVDYDDISYADYGVTVRLVWGSTRVQNGELSWTRSYTSSAYFDIDADGVMTLRNASASAASTGNGLCAAYNYGGWTFDNAMLYQTTLTPAGDIPEAPVMYDDDDIDAMAEEGGDFVKYYRSGYAWNRDDEGYLDIEEQTGFGYVYYAENGDVYMRTPVSGWYCDKWMKGTKDGNTLSFPLNQYFYWDDEFFGLRTTYGLFALDTTTNKITYTIDPDKTDITFTIDGNTITMNDCGYIDDDMTQFVGLGGMVDSAYIDRNIYCMDWYTVLYGIPEAPTAITVNPGSTTATVSWTDNENEMWNVRYREVKEGVTFYECDFETNESLEGWWLINADGDSGSEINWGIYNNDDPSMSCGQYSAASRSFGKAPDNWIVSPMITLGEVVKFNAWGYNPGNGLSYDENLKVYFYVGDDPEAIEGVDDFMELSDDITVDDDMDHEYILAIPEEYQGMTGCIAFRHYNSDNKTYLQVDNIFVGDPDVGAWTYVNGVTDPEVVLQGLTPETDYEVEVQAVIPYVGPGEWSASVPFRTLADQPQPVVLRGDVDGSGQVGMDDLALLISYLLDPNTYLPIINYDNAAICDDTTSDTVGMDDLAALISFLLAGQWPN